MCSQKTKMELWRQCAAWLIDCRVLPENHRVTWEGAQVNEGCPILLNSNIESCHTSTNPGKERKSVKPCLLVSSGVRVGPGAERWSVTVPAAEQPAASCRQPERDQPAASNVPGNKSNYHRLFL